MSERVFIDTNVLIYARDERDPRKRDVARSWLGVLSDAQLSYINLQVLNEFTRWTLARAPERDVSTVRSEIDRLRVWGEKPLDQDDVEIAWSVREAFGFQWYDCLLLAAAHHAGCHIFLSEDLTDRARFKSVLVVNPFGASPSDFLTRH